MDEAVAALDKGSRVWYRQDNKTWLLGELKERHNGITASVQLVNGKTLPNVDLNNIVPANPTVQQAIADLTQLSYLNEPSILDNLNQRYQQDVIYTNAGPVLIAVNPCKGLPLYTAEVADEYKGTLLSAQDFHSTANVDEQLLLDKGFPMVKSNSCKPANSPTGIVTAYTSAHRA